MLSQSGQFVARMDRFAEIRSFVEAFCLLAQASRFTSLRLTLIVEELFTNSVQHGYGGSGDNPIWLSISYLDGEMEITYEDAAPPYDPFQGPSKPFATPGGNSVRLGGWGLGLVKGLGNSVSYTRADDRNRICLTLSFGDSGVA